MTRGFSDVAEFQPVIGWELYQVSLDKYHVMFWFENGHALLMIASAFSFRSGDGRVNYTYQLPRYDEEKTGRTSLDVSRILRTAVREVRISSARDLELIFTRGDVLVVHDNPETMSWWFYLYETDETIPENRPLKWFVSDIESDDDI